MNFERLVCSGYSKKGNERLPLFGACRFPFLQPFISPRLINVICNVNICVAVTSSSGKLLPSIYSKFNVQIEGYEHLNLSMPVTDVGVAVGIKYCYVNPNNVATQRRKRHQKRYFIDYLETC